VAEKRNKTLPLMTLTALIFTDRLGLRRRRERPGFRKKPRKKAEEEPGRA
jgi:hypothetical protein